MAVFVMGCCSIFCSFGRCFRDRCSFCGSLGSGMAFFGCFGCGVSPFGAGCGGCSSISGSTIGHGSRFLCGFFCRDSGINSRFSGAKTIINHGRGNVFTGSRLERDDGAGTFAHIGIVDEVNAKQSRNQNHNGWKHIFYNTGEVHFYRSRDEFKSYRCVPVSRNIVKAIRRHLNCNGGKRVFSSYTQGISITYNAIFLFQHMSYAYSKS